MACSHDGIEPVEFRTLVQELRRGTFQHSTNWVPLPEEYLEPARSGTSGGSGPGVSGAPSVIPVSGNSSVSSGRTAVSSLTADTTRPSLTRIENPTPDAEFSNITVRPGGTRPILRERRPPMNDAHQKAKFIVSEYIYLVRT